MPCSGIRFAARTAIATRATHPQTPGSMKLPLWSAALLVLSPVPAFAQTAADTTSLADAVAAVLGDSAGRRLGTGPHRFLGAPATDFDRAVTMRLEDRLRLPILSALADTATWVATRGAQFRGDSAAVLVEHGTTARPNPGIHTYIETERYHFVRTPGGWSYVRRDFVRGADIGDVRG